MQGPYLKLTIILLPCKNWYFLQEMQMQLLPAPGLLADICIVVSLCIHYCLMPNSAILMLPNSYKKCVVDSKHTHKHKQQLCESKEINKRVSYELTSLPQETNNLKYTQIYRNTMQVTLRNTDFI